MERLAIGLPILGLTLVMMIVIAWLAMRESRREYDAEMRRMTERQAGRGRTDPPILTPAVAQPPDPAPS